jgi:hypothetical protein
VNLTLRKLLNDLRKLADLGLISKARVDKLFHKLPDWSRGAQSNWSTDRRTTEPAKPTERAALLRYDAGRDGKMVRLSNSTDNAVALLSRGVAMVKHGLEAIRVALEQLEPMSPKAAQAAVEAEHRAANRCALGHDLRPGDRLRNGLCEKHNRAQDRAEKKEAERRRQREELRHADALDAEVVTGTDGP